MNKKRLDAIINDKLKQVMQNQEQLKQWTEVRQSKVRWVNARRSNAKTDKKDGLRWTEARWTIS